MTTILRFCFIIGLLKKISFSIIYLDMKKACLHLCDLIKFAINRLWKNDRSPL